MKNFFPDIQYPMTNLQNAVPRFCTGSGVFFHPPEETILKMPDEQMIEDASRIMAQILDEEARKNRKRLK